MIHEIWLPLCEGYEISIFGRIKSLPKKVKLFNGAEYLTKEKILRPRIGKQGYAYVALFDNGKRVDKRISRLMALAFIPNEFNKPEVNHKNGIRNDNHIQNLEWATHGENIKHSYDNLNRKKAHLGKFGFDHVASREVINILTGEILTILDAAKISGVSKTHMGNMLNGYRTNWTNFKTYND